MEKQSNFEIEDDDTRDLCEMIFHQGRKKNLIVIAEDTYFDQYMYICRQSIYKCFSDMCEEKNVLFNHPFISACVQRQVVFF